MLYVVLLCNCKVGYEPASHTQSVRLVMRAIMLLEGFMKKALFIWVNPTRITDQAQAVTACKTHASGVLSAHIVRSANSMCCQTGTQHFCFWSSCKHATGQQQSKSQCYRLKVQPMDFYSSHCQGKDPLSPVCWLLHADHLLYFDVSQPQRVCKCMWMCLQVSFKRVN